MAPSTSGAKFASVSEEDFEELTFEEQRRRKHLECYKKSSTYSESFSDGKKICQQVDKLTLASVFSKFYLEVRKTDGEHYKTASLNSIRAGINHNKIQFENLESGEPK